MLFGIFSLMREILHALRESGRIVSRWETPSQCGRVGSPEFLIQYRSVVRWSTGAHAICGLGSSYHSTIKKRWSDVEHWTVSTSLKSSWNYVEISTELNVQRKFNDRLVLIMVENSLKSGWVELQRWFNVETRLNLQRCKCNTLKISWKMVELNFQRWFNGDSTLKVELCLLGRALGLTLLK